jgi:two-component system, NarL family, response regulator NreC
LQSEVWHLVSDVFLNNIIRPNKYFKQLLFINFAVHKLKIEDFYVQNLKYLFFVPIFFQHTSKRTLFLIRMASILIVDDHNIFAEGIGSILNREEAVQVLGHCDSAASLMDFLACKAIPDILLLDLSLPDVNGLDLCESILMQYPTIKIMMLTMYSEPQIIRRAMRKGVRSYLLKNTAQAELLTAVKAVQEGKIYVNEAIGRLLLEEQQRFNTHFHTPGTAPRLTLREQETLELIAKGLTTRQIAEKLFITAKAVEFHRSSLLAKFVVHNTAGLIKQAVEYRMV